MADARAPLTRDRVVAGAVELADDIGIAPLTIRRLADHLGVRPMAIYHHLPNKDAIVDGMVDAVFAEIDLPAPGADWPDGMRTRCHSARAVLARHPWATSLMDSRTTPGPENLRHHDAVIACLRGGLTMEMTAHAFALLDAYVYGFAVQEAALPFRSPEEVPDAVDEIMGGVDAEQYPSLVAMAAEHVLQPGYDFGDEFAYGLELILDGLADRAAAERGAR